MQENGYVYLLILRAFHLLSSHRADFAEEVLISRSVVVWENPLASMDVISAILAILEYVRLAAVICNQCVKG